MKFAWQIADGMSYLCSKNVSYSIGIFFLVLIIYRRITKDRILTLKKCSSSSAKEFLNYDEGTLSLLCGLTPLLFDLS